MGLPSTVAIAAGTKYDLATNISVLDGMTNGAECIVENIDYRVVNSTRPSIIWVSFQESTCNIGKNHRRDYSHLYTKHIDKTWTPVLEVTRQFKVDKRSQAQVLRRQFPLRQASAKTIHRCQGDTLNQAVVDLPASAREHMHYVGLSRVRNISGLHILNLNEKKITVSKKVQEEMARLRTEASLKPCVSYLYQTRNSSMLKILFQNVRSLHLHIQDVASDYSVQVADVNIFVETALCSRDNDETYTLNNFQLYRNDFHTHSTTRSVYGTAVYVRNTLQCVSTPYRCNYNNVEITVTVVNQPIQKSTHCRHLSIKIKSDTTKVYRCIKSSL